MIGLICKFLCTLTNKKKKLTEAEACERETNYWVVLDSILRNQCDSVIDASFLYCCPFPELFGVEEGTDPITGLQKRDYDLKAFTQRNKQLYNRFRKRIYSSESNNPSYPRSEDGIERIKETRESLPIAEFR